MAIKNTLSKRGATRKTTSTAPTIDKQSVLNMGYGPLSPKGLADKVASGKATKSITNGVISFKKAAPKPVGVTAGTTGVKKSSGASSGKMMREEKPRNATTATSSGKMMREEKPRQASSPGNVGRTARKDISANRKLY